MYKALHRFRRLSRLVDYAQTWQSHPLLAFPCKVETVRRGGNLGLSCTSYSLLLSSPFSTREKLQHLMGIDQSYGNLISKSERTLNYISCLKASQLSGFSTSMRGQSETKDEESDEGGTETLKDKIVVISLPQLSPHMKDGKIRQWLKQPGEEISMYDVIFEVDTDNLSEDAYKVGDFAGTVTMLVEAQEEGVLSEILVPEGQLVNVQTPVAIMCELEEDLEDLQGSSDKVKKIVASDNGSLRSLTWQSYLKESKEGPKGCS